MAAHHLHLHDLDLDCSCHASAADGHADDEEDGPTLADRPREVPLGEFLVAQRAIDRHQLLRALQMQDNHPGARLGECLAALGIIAHAELEGHLVFLAAADA